VTTPESKEIEKEVRKENLRQMVELIAFVAKPRNIRCGGVPCVECPCRLEPIGTDKGFSCIANQIDDLLQRRSFK
jgi:hypothetical protein